MPKLPKDEVYKIYLKRIEEGFYEVKDGNLMRDNRVIGHVNTSSHGYRVYSIKAGTILAHRLMYAYYHGLENLDKNLTINHIDGNKTNNRKENLELMSLTDNTRHQWRTGLGKTQNKNPNTILNEEKVKEIKILLRDTNLSQQKIADKFGVSRSSILNINLGNNWKHVEID